jgi:hypothetical protein
LTMQPIRSAYVRTEVKVILARAALNGNGTPP